MQNESIKALSSATALALALLIPHTACAQRTPLACHVEAAGGLKWESGRWLTARFKENKFILVQDGTSLTSESAGKAMGAATASCTVVFKDRVSCTDEVGGFMLFDPKTKQGTIAQMLGGTSASTVQRDTLEVEAFSCQPF